MFSLTLTDTSCSLIILVAQCMKTLHLTLLGVTERVLTCSDSSLRGMSLHYWPDWLKKNWKVLKKHNVVGSAGLLLLQNTSQIMSLEKSSSLWQRGEQKKKRLEEKKNHTELKNSSLEGKRQKTGMFKQWLCSIRKTSDVCLGNVQRLTAYNCII